MTSEPSGLLQWSCGILVGSRTCLWGSDAAYSLGWQIAAIGGLAGSLDILDCGVFDCVHRGASCSAYVARLPYPVVERRFHNVPTSKGRKSRALERAPADRNSWSACNRAWSWRNSLRNLENPRKPWQAQVWSGTAGVELCQYRVWNSSFVFPCCLTGEQVPNLLFLETETRLGTRA